MAIVVKWDRAMLFTATSETGAKVTMDTGRAYGGSGKYPTPMELVAMALGGCTGMDVVSILEKMRVKLKKFEIEVKTKRREQVPRYYESIHLVYILSGEKLTEEKARRAIELSKQKYCSVSIMLQEKAKITYEMRIE